MANDLIPDYILLKEAAKYFRTEVDSILSLAGEGQLTLWVCYTAIQYRNQITYVGQNRKPYWYLMAEEVRELRTRGIVRLEAPNQRGFVDEYGNYLQFSDKYFTLTSTPERKSYFRTPSDGAAIVDVDSLYVHSRELKRLIEAYRKESKASESVGPNYSAHTILGGIYKRIHPHGKWKRCSEISFQDWILRCLKNEKINEDGITFAFENSKYKLFVESPDPPNEQMFISAAFNKVGQPTGRLQNYTADNLAEAIKPNKINRLLDNSSFQYIEGCPY